MIIGITGTRDIEGMVKNSPLRFDRLHTLKLVLKKLAGCFYFIGVMLFMV